LHRPEIALQVWRLSLITVYTFFSTVINCILPKIIHTITNLPLHELMPAATATQTSGLAILPSSGLFTKFAPHLTLFAAASM
jgi:hypothetical protein